MTYEDSLVYILDSEDDDIPFGQRVVGVSVSFISLGHKLKRTLVLPPSVL